MRLAWIHPVVASTLACLLGCADPASNEEQEALRAEVRELRESVAELSADVEALRAESRRPPSNEAEPNRPPGADPSTSKELAELLAAPAKPLPFDSPSDTGAPTRIEGIECAPGRCRVPKRLRDDVLKDPSSITKEVRLVPSMHQDQFNGFKLYAIRQGSILQALGFRNGDRVVTLAGKSIGSPSDLLELYGQLDRVTELPIRLVRSGELYELVIELRD